MHSPLQFPALDPLSVNEEEKTGYPPAFHSRVKGRKRRKLGDLLGLTQFGVNLTTLAPGTQSALRHWHSLEDEFIYVTSGELVLVTNSGEQRVSAGQCAGFAAGDQDAHHLINRSSAPAQFLEIGSRKPQDLAAYPDDDVLLVMATDGKHTLHRDWTRYD